jgi:hypothetical protein
MVDKKNLIIHAGTHKTGTSSLQKSFKNFDNSNIRYLSFDEENHSIPIYSCFTSDPSEYHIYKNKKITINKINQLNDQWLKIFSEELSLPHRTLILSGEDIGLLKYEELIRLKFFVKNYNRKPIIYIYVRPPQHLASSLLQQWIRGGLKKCPKIQITFYQERIQSLAEAFGLENLRIRDFSKLHDRSVVKDFSSCIGVKNPPKEIRANESLFLDAVRALFIFNRFGIQSFGSSDHMIARNKFIRLLNSLSPQQSFKLPEKHCLNFFLTQDILWTQTFLESHGYMTTEEWDFNIHSLKDFDPDSIDNFLMEDTPELKLRLILWLKEKGVSASSSNDMVTLQNFAYSFIFDNIDLP